MVDYIDREKTIRELSKMINYCKTDSENALTALFQVGDMLMDLPSIEIVVVVRCKDCKYYTAINPLGNQGVCGCGEKEMNYNGEFYQFYNDYCSYGERKE